MKPYNRKFLLEKIKEYNDVIKEDTIGAYKIVKSKNDSEILIGYGYKKDNDLDIETLKLYENDKLWMELSAREIEGTYGIIKKAHGKVGLVGLGLGYSAVEISKRKNVREVIVYESQQEIIDLFKKNFGELRKIKIIKEDAFKAKSEKFDYFFVDIYRYELSKNVSEDYKKFHEIHEIKDYVFWGMEHFLLSARYEEIVWVYVPELWMDMSKRTFAALQDSNYIEVYEKLDGELVSSVLGEFKVILDE